MIRLNGAAFNHQNLSGALEFYTCFVTSPGAYTLPSSNPPEIEWGIRSLNIDVTGNLADQSQRNFEILLQSIGLRAMPNAMSDPEPVLDLALAGAPSLTGEGFVWKFAVEHSNVFSVYSAGVVSDPTGLLKKDLDGVIIDSNVRITTVDGSPSGINKNIEIVRNTFL